MNTSSRVPGLTRNSGWRSVDAELTARRLLEKPESVPAPTVPVGK